MSRKPTFADKYVGKKVKELRKKFKVSQSELGRLIGVSHQQIQQYENGDSRVSAGHLFDLANIFNVTANHFFEGLTYSLEERKNSLSENGIINAIRYSPLRVLIAEDNPSYQSLLTEAINSCRKDVVFDFVSNGEEAMDYLKSCLDRNSIRRKPDIILTDINMPKRGGIDILRYCKKNEMLKAIPIIVMSGSLKIEDLENSYKNFCSGYLKKSEDIKKLFELIESTINYWSSIVTPGMQYEYV
jgi:CheY-like chemotaxis protein/DNA-binding XRE family transcriptional regulator